MRTSRRPRLAGILAALLAVTLALALPGCASLPAGGGGEPSAAEEGAAARELFAARLRDLLLAAVPDPVALGGLRRDLDRAAERPGAGRLERGRIEGLRAEAALLAGEPQAARRHAESAAELSGQVEEAWLTLAALEREPARRLVILEAGLAKADGRSRLLCERGRLLLEAGRYAEAAQDLDEGLRGLDPAWLPRYGADRDRALTLARVEREGAAGTSPAPGGLPAGPLSQRAMVERLFAETRLGLGLTAKPAPSYASLLPALAEARLLLDPAAPPDASVTRKALAYFLWGILARVERDPSLLVRYRSKFAASPVPDLGRDEPWFDAALGLVERELMELPDGRHFRPEEGIDALEYLSILRKLGKLYP